MKSWQADCSTKLLGAVTTDMCVNNLKGRLELATEDMRYSEIREDMMSVIRRRRDTF